MSQSSIEKKLELFNTFKRATPKRESGAAFYFIALRRALSALGTNVL